MTVGLGGPDPQTPLPSHRWFGAVCRHRLEVQRGENRALISLPVPEIWGSKVLPLAPPSGQTRNIFRQIILSADSARRVLDVCKIWGTFDEDPDF